MATELSFPCSQESATCPFLSQINPAHALSPSISSYQYSVAYVVPKNLFKYKVF